MCDGSIVPIAIIVHVRFDFTFKYSNVVLPVVILRNVYVESLSNPMYLVD